MAPSAQHEHLKLKYDRKIHKYQKNQKENIS